MAKVAVSRITSKGQVTIPEEIRSAHHLQAGEQIEWEVTDHGTIEIRRVGGRIEDLVSILPRPQRAVTIDGMKKAVGAHLARKHRARG
jgi:AbrB family looped-hinge helix DNA binding protein